MISGGLPYLGTSITTVYLAHSAQLAATGVVTNIDPGVALTILDQALNIQVTYGAVMLSFLGRCHSPLMPSQCFETVCRRIALGNGVCWLWRRKRLCASSTGSCPCPLRMAHARPATHVSTYLAMDWIHGALVRRFEGYLERMGYDRFVLKVLETPNV